MNAHHAVQRLPHAVLGLDSRRRKAAKIELLMGLAGSDRPLRILEVGTGGGGIAHYFGTHPILRCEVTAVDVHDIREVEEGYRFVKVEGVDLPFDDQGFDLVITNHVIEHVGDYDDQLRHLGEIHRVMKVGGSGYLAVPNRWMLVEPHYRLAFLSWLPRRLRTPYLRLLGRGSHYDCEPLQMRQLERMLAGSGFASRNLCVEAMHATSVLEAGGSFGLRAALVLPDAWLHTLSPIIPTLIYRLERLR